MRLVDGKTLDESHLRPALEQRKDDTTTATTTDAHDSCLCIRATKLAPLDLRLISDVDDNKRLDEKSLDMVEATRPRLYKFSRSTPDKMPCMTHAKEQESS